MKKNANLDMGWGKLIFANTFQSAEKLADLICNEERGKRDLTMYASNPHVIISKAPHEIFLDPSHTYRLNLLDYKDEKKQSKSFTIGKVKTKKEIDQINKIYQSRHMVTADREFLYKNRNSKIITYLIAKSRTKVLGVVIGVDHKLAFQDPKNGSSFWSLAVDPQSSVPGIGESLVRAIISYYQDKGRDYIDLSVMHYNKQAIELYHKLGFFRIKEFCLKHKSPLNEPYFVKHKPEEKLNPYAEAIVKEARKRGIYVDVFDNFSGYFSLTFGGRTITCKESLSELTNAISLSICEDRGATNRILKKAGLSVPEQMKAGRDDAAFLSAHKTIVVKPSVGEKGKGVTVDVTTKESLKKAVQKAKRVSNLVILEEKVIGLDLRVVVIDYEVVAAAIRKPPFITGTGKHSVQQLLDKLNRRKAAATKGENMVPMDDETKQMIKKSGYGLESVLPEGKTLALRKITSLYTGSMLEDVTPILNSSIKEAAIKAAKAIDIPIVGLDFIVPDVTKGRYKIVEAKARVGLTNHEPNPTIERFVDLLFPQTSKYVKTKKVLKV